jgi:hypothetical protein
MYTNIEKECIHIPGKEWVLLLVFIMYSLPPSTQQMAKLVKNRMNKAIIK